MDLWGVTEENPGEAIFGPDDALDDAAFENEMCGICMDIVIDRGLLDCCSHWFCFACIDNWATITSLCPICKKEFQLITCLPVYDTIGNVKIEENLLSRDDDWYIQGRNNTLSFPSYYINEDAVICLDGDGCKIRNKLSTEEDSNLDTSIACDSCDIWYHAFCVGFDPERSLENSWLCPRCVGDESAQNVNRIPKQNPCNHHFPNDAGSGQSVDSAFSGKVSISLADTGETAIVVSMIEGEQLTRGTGSGLVETEPFTNAAIEIEASTTNVDIYNTESESEQCSYRNCVDGGDDRSLTKNAAVSHNQSESALGLSSERTTISSDNLVQESDFGLSSSLEASPDCAAIHSEDGELRISHGLFTSEGDTAICDVTEVEVVDGSAQYSNEGFSLSAEKLVKDADGDIVLVDCKNLEENDSIRNHIESLGSPLMEDAYTGDQLKKRERDPQAKVATEMCAKREKLDENFHVVPQNCPMDLSALVNSKNFSSMPTTSKDSESKLASVMEDCTSDIMSIVQDNCKSANRQFSGERTLEESTDGKQPGVGLRVKKIMRRVGEDKESSLLVQKLRKEIRETVRNKDLSDLSKDDAFDGKLLSAFRAAIAGPRDKVGKIDPSLARGKKSLLQKGKVRENLIKKIYGTASGRRRRAWDRDWEVEFWKHRCTSSQPEKVETLQSVLDLLKKITSSPVNYEIERGLDIEASNSILSRVYLADASVLPRSEDIKPLSALKMVGVIEQQKQDNFSTLPDKNLSTNIIKTASEIALKSLQSVVTSHDKRVTTYDSNFKSETCFRKEQPVGLKVEGKSSISASRNSTASEKSLKESFSNSGSDRSDKRKWALEVLARKDALTNRDTSQRKEEDNPIHKETYPLLAQLPLEMRPMPAPTQHNKVPMPVRQAQLYRLTEHYLRKANVPVICRTADVELAVADAVNIEKEICETSKSKLVYVNLCSQHTIKSSKVEKVIFQWSPKHGTELVSDEHVSSDMTIYPASTNDSVEQALRLAGLLSDSPPDSPVQPTKCSDEANPAIAGAEDLENSFDTSSHPNLDIYGDCDHDLDDKGYNGLSNVSSCLGESKLQNEDGDSRRKMLICTTSCERLSSLDTEDGKTKIPNSQAEAASDLDKLGTVEADSRSSFRGLHDHGTCNPSLKTTNDTCLLIRPTTGSSEDKITQEPSELECKELHGPEKECIGRTVYAEAMEATAGNMTLDDRENDRLKNEAAGSRGEHESCENTLSGSRLPGKHESSERENSPSCSLPSEHIANEQTSTSISGKKLPELSNCVSKKVEAYIKEHIRPLCKSGVITVEQYRWAVAKTTEKVMNYHCKAKSASFLIKEGDRVKKLAEEYVEASQRKEWKLKLPP